MEQDSKKVKFNDFSEAWEREENGKISTRAITGYEIVVVREGGLCLMLKVAETVGHLKKINAGLAEPTKIQLAFLDTKDARETMADLASAIRDSMAAFGKKDN